MKAMIFEEYGPPEVLHLSQVPKPVPNRKEVLVRVKATTVTAGDWRMRKAEPFAARLYNGLFRPRKVNILGFELAGIVEEVGKDVHRFKLGDEIFGYSGLRFGAYAEYICLPDNGDQNKGLAALKPANLSFAQAAAIPTGALAALNNLRLGKIEKGARVLVYGASGSVGTYALQIAHYLGAEVTGVCSTRNIDMIRSLGAQHVVDYTKQKLSEVHQTYDLIFDAVGKLPRSIAKKLLTPNGYYRHIGMNRKDGYQDLEYLAELAKNGNLKPVIDKQYNFEQIPEAHRYVEAGHKRGNVVIIV